VRQLLGPALRARGETQDYVQEAMGAKPVDNSLVQRLRRAGRRYQAALPASDR
jgi:hypothetical protein